MQIRVIGPLALSIVLAAAATADTAGPADRAPGFPGDTLAPHPSTVWNERAANSCFGGFHHGKHVVAEEHLRHTRRDTTVTDCIAQGGRTGWLPRFAPVSAGERLG